MDRAGTTWPVYADVSNHMRDRPVQNTANPILVPVTFHTNDDIEVTTCDPEVMTDFNNTLQRQAGES